MTARQDDDLVYWKKGETPVLRKAKYSKKPASRSAVERLQAKHQGIQCIAPEECQRLIAEQRGFQDDQSLEDWLYAEAEVGAHYAARH